MSTSSRLSKIVQTIPPSGIRRFFDLANSMQGVISLGVGEPDFVTSWKVREYSIFSIEKGYTSYTPNSGIPELRQEIASYLKRSFQLEYDPNGQVLVTVGASEAIDLALRAITDPGDDILIVDPCFVSYDPLIRLAGGNPVPIPTKQEDNFKLTPEALREKITPRTKAIILCFPNNPTGTTMDREELEAISKVIAEHDLIVIADEIYAELSFEQKHVSIASCSKMLDRTILISGLSKAFAMTGWRIGYACGPRDILQAMTKIHQYTIMCAPIMGQKAAVEALRNGRPEMEKMVESYKHRRNYMVNALREIGLDCHMPGGSFYVFPSIQSTGFTSEEFAERLLIEQKVAVVPGNVFGQSGEGYIRCSIATSIEQLEIAVEKMKGACHHPKFVE